MGAVTSLKPMEAKLYSDLIREDNLELLHWESARGDFVNVEYVFSAFADKQDSFWFWTIPQTKNCPALFE